MRVVDLRSVQILGIKGEDLKEYERILERYVTDNNTMHIVDEL